MGSSLCRRIHLSARLIPAFIPALKTTGSTVFGPPSILLFQISKDVVDNRDVPVPRESIPIASERLW